jgi:hypothetical protein
MQSHRTSREPFADPIRLSGRTVRLSADTPDTPSLTVRLLQGEPMTLTARGRTWATLVLCLAYVASFMVGLLTDWSLA